MTILILNDNSGPKYHRLLLPCALMPGIELKVADALTDELCEGVDILFFNRVISQTSIQSVLDLRTKHGFKMVVDFDDHWQLGPDHYLYEMYQRTRASEVMEIYIKESDAVTVTHDRLADEVRGINPNVHVLPNAIPKWGQFLCKKTPDDLTRLFWAGGITHTKDIQLLFEPVKQLRSLPVKMVMGGYSKRPEYYEMRNAFTRYGRMPHELIESLPVQEYYYAYSKCDIALVPLTDTRFNSFKSNIKILEAANIGANVVASNVHPYKDIPGVQYVNEPGDWYDKVKWLLDGNSTADVLQAYCDEHFNFGEINKQRKHLFDTLCNPQTASPSNSTAASTPAG